MSKGNLSLKLFKYDLDEQTMSWTENWLNSKAQRVVISGMNSSWRPVTSSIPWGSILCPILFNIVINYLDDGTACTFSKFADDTELGGVTDAPNGHAALQKAPQQAGETG